MHKKILSNSHGNAIGRYRRGSLYLCHGDAMFLTNLIGDYIMKIWTKPAVREQEVGLEVTSYLPAEIDII